MATAAFLLATSKSSAHSDALSPLDWTTPESLRFVDVFPLEQHWGSIGLRQGSP
jgi:hypothetical protein